jgi:hypothetical protein
VSQLLAQLQRVFNMFVRISGSDFPPTKTRKNVPTYTCQLKGSFPGTGSTRSSDFNPIDSNIETLVHSATIENKEALHKSIFMPVKSITTAPGQFKGCDSPKLLSIQVENILSIFL